MLPTLESRSARYGLFFSVYFYQGIVAGFSLTALANHLAARGLPAAEVGLHFALAGLPWTVQPLVWGPLVDRTGEAAMGRRRFWGVVAALGAQTCLSLLLFAPDAGALWLIGGVFFLHSLCASLLDTTCDRLILDHVPAAELGRMSGCTRGGFVLGTSLGAALFGWALEALGFAASVRILLFVTSLALLPLVLVRERRGDAFASRQRARAAARLPLRRFVLRLVAGLRRRAALRLVALCFVVDALLGAFEVRFGVDLVQGQGWDAASLSRVQALLALITGTVGALGIGLWADRSGPHAPLTCLILGSAAAYGAAFFLIGGGPSPSAALPIIALTGTMPALIVVALVPVLMTASRGRTGAATRFEVFMATMNLGSVFGSAVSGQLAALVPLPAVAALVSLGLLACLLLSAARSPAPSPARGR